MTKRIAVIGYDTQAVYHVADSIAEKINWQVCKDQNEVMLDLLKTDVKKHFASYQLHVLLNRSLNWKGKNKIICDTLFTDYCTMIAAMESGVITKEEYDIYAQKQTEFIETFQECCAIIYIHSDTALYQEQSIADPLPLKYMKLAHQYFTVQINKLKQEMKDKFIQIDSQSSLDEHYNKIAHLLQIDSNLKTEPIQETVEKSQSIREIILMRFPYMNIVDTKEEIRKRIDAFKAMDENINDYPCVHIEDEICTCLKISYDAEGDEEILCREYTGIQDVIDFFTKE